MYPFIFDRLRARCTSGSTMKSNKKVVVEVAGVNVNFRVACKFHDINFTVQKVTRGIIVKTIEKKVIERRVVFANLFSKNDCGVIDEWAEREKRNYDMRAFVEHFGYLGDSTTRTR